jgi:hypothetical protein
MTAKRNTPWRVLLSVLALVFAASIVAGCGSKKTVSVNQKNEERVAAAWLGEGVPKVSCRERTCEIGIRQPFVDASEAWLIAVPVTTYHVSPETQGVNRIILRVTDKKRGRVAVFRCSLRRESNRVGSTNVVDAHRMCKGSVAPMSGP